MGGIKSKEGSLHCRLTRGGRYSKTAGVEVKGDGNREEQIWEKYLSKNPEHLIIFNMKHEDGGPSKLDEVGANNRLQ